MNNSCKRKCYWNYTGQCVCDNEAHFNNGTSYTSNCSEFLEQNFECKLQGIYAECEEMLCHMNLKQLKQAKHSLFDIKERRKEMFEIYNKKTNKTVDVETDKCFKDFGIVIELDGHIIMTQHGELVCSADDRIYGVRVKTPTN
ncbi:MAG: hypothetical protein AB9836_04820 [Aminipila sp.]